MTIPELLRVTGFGPDKAEKYGAEICAICRGESIAASGPAPKRVPHSSLPHRDQRAPTAIQESSAVTFKRERPTATNPADSLDPDQQALEIKLRAWRKSESERIGLPQFFVLGTTTLRSIVMSRPQTLAELKGISGIDPEKLDKFGPSIIALCNA